MPSAPYCDSGDVYLMTIFAQNKAASDFTESTQPRKTIVEYWIDHIASQIDMAYASVGYDIPFAAITGEDWPTHQTTFLKYFNSVGVASMTSGAASSPPVVNFIQGRRVERSFYEVEWSRLIEGVKALGQKVVENLVLLRASTRAGSSADHMLTDSMPPLSDFLQGYTDPTLFDTLRDFTNRMQTWYTAEVYEQGMEPSWENRYSPDHLYLLQYRLGLLSPET